MAAETSPKPPKSEQFGDVYFSAYDGLAETRHVFLAGNRLPEAWAGRKKFTIAETGFGTGLNFLAAAQMFRQTAPPGARLDYISIEKYPLKPDDIERYLAHWSNEFPQLLRELCAQYPAPLPGFHKILFGSDISLLIIFDDVADALPQIAAQVDCWFLDGFKPATNPEMWTQHVFENMARLSAPNARFSTFTAAGAVRRGLVAAGFQVDKIKGYGTKRDMLAGHYKGAA